MRPSSLPAYRVSQLRPQHLNLREGERRSVRCPECGTWRMIRRGMVWPHQVDDDLGLGSLRCSGSARRVVMDLTVQQWEQRLAEGTAAVAPRRATQVSPKPSAPAVRQPAGERACAWADVLVAVKRTDAERERRPQGAAPEQGPALPLEPLRVAV